MLAHSRGICWEAGGTQHGREDRGCQVWCLLPEPLDLGELRDRSGLSRALAASWHGVQTFPGQLRLCLSPMRACMMLEQEPAPERGRRALGAPRCGPMGPIPSRLQH